MPIDFSYILSSDDRERIGTLIDENMSKGVNPNVKDVTKLLEDQFPLGYVLYSDGSKHSIQEYSDMLVSTTIIDSQRDATFEFIRNNPTDLVQVSFEGSDHPGCALFEGQIFSLSGLDPNFPSLDVAMGPGGLFHPRCIHTVFPIYNDDLSSSKELRENNLKEIIQSTIFTSRFAKDIAAVSALWESQKKILGDKFDIEYEVNEGSKDGTVDVVATIIIKNTGEKATLKSTIEINRPVGKDESSLSSQIKQLRTL